MVRSSASTRTADRHCSSDALTALRGSAIQFFWPTPHPYHLQDATGGGFTFVELHHPSSFATQQPCLQAERWGPLAGFFPALVSRSKCQRAPEVPCVQSSFALRIVQYLDRAEQRCSWVVAAEVSQNFRTAPKHKFHWREHSHFQQVVSSPLAQHRKTISTRTLPRVGVSATTSRRMISSICAWCSTFPCCSFAPPAVSATSIPRCSLPFLWAPVRFQPCV